MRQFISHISVVSVEPEVLVGLAHDDPEEAEQVGAEKDQHNQFKQADEEGNEEDLLVLGAIEDLIVGSFMIICYRVPDRGHLPILKELHDAASAVDLHASKEPLKFEEVEQPLTLPVKGQQLQWDNRNDIDDQLVLNIVLSDFLEAGHRFRSILRGEFFKEHQDHVE